MPIARLSASSAAALLALAAGQASAGDVAMVRLAATSITATDLTVGTTATVSITDEDGAPTTLPYDVTVTVTGGVLPVTITVRAGSTSASASLGVPEVAVGSTVRLGGSFSGEAGTGTVAASFTILPAIAADG